MLKNLKIMGLCTILLTVTPPIYTKTCAWNTFCKIISGIGIGIPAGFLRSNAHFYTRDFAQKIWGNSESFVLRKPLAIAIGFVMCLGVHSFIEISRTNITEKIEQNLDDERENIYLTDTIARYIDWIIGLVDIAGFELTGEKNQVLALFQQLVATPPDDTLPGYTTTG